MESFFELIQKIPKSFYETEIGVSTDPIENLIDGGLCIYDYPTLNGIGGSDNRLDIILFDTDDPDYSESIGRSMKLTRTSVDPGEVAYYYLGDEQDLNELIPGEVYTFALDIWIPGGAISTDMISLEILDAVSSIWEGTQKSALDADLQFDMWQRFYVTRILRSGVEQTLVKINLGDIFPQDSFVYIRQVQLENRDIPSPFANIGTWYASWSAGNVAKLFNLYSSSFDEIKSVIEDIASLREIWKQEGAVLDEIGKIVKEPRRNLTDEEYRGFLYVAIQRNNSSGSLGTISQLVKLVIQDNNYTVRDLHNARETTFDGKRLLDGTRLLNPGVGQPAAFDVHIPSDKDRDYLTDLIQEIKSAGVNAEVKYNDEEI